MGLLIDKPQPAGVTASYWNIMASDFSFDSNVNAANIELRGYISKDARDAGFAPLTVEKVHISGIKSLFEQSSTSIYGGLYNAVKTQSAWSSATDDL